MEDETVAHRVDSYNKAVVFSEQPVPLGGTFQVKLLDKGGGWAGSLVSWGSFRVRVGCILNSAHLGGCVKLLGHSLFRFSEKVKVALSSK